MRRPCRSVKQAITVSTAPAATSSRSSSSVSIAADTTRAASAGCNVRHIPLASPHTLQSKEADT